MPELRNDLLRFEHLTANATMTAFRLAIFRTRRRYGGICYNSMTAYLVKYGAANSTSLRRYARRGRSGGMTVRRNALCTFLIATTARRSLHAFFRASRSLCLHILSPIMPQSGNYFLRRDNRVAPRTMAAFRLTCHCTRRRNCRIRYRTMTEGRDCLRRRRTAARASCRLRARRRACRRFGRRIAAIVMAQRRRLIAGIAVTAAAAIMVCIAARGTRRAVIRCAHVMSQSGR